MQKNSAHVQGYFNRNKNLDTLYFVESQAFKKESDAKSQVKNLKKENVKVIPVTRAEAFAGSESGSGEQTDNQDGDQTGNQDTSGSPETGNTGGGKKSLDDHAAEVTAAEAALAAATEANDEEAIAVAKKKLQTAKMAQGRAVKAAEKAAQQ